MRPLRRGLHGSLSVDQSGPRSEKSLSVEKRDGTGVGSGTNHDVLIGTGGGHGGLDGLERRSSLKGAVGVAAVGAVHEVALGDLGGVDGDGHGGRGAGETVAQGVRERVRTYESVGRGVGEGAEVVGRGHGSTLGGRRLVSDGDVAVGPGVEGVVGEHALNGGDGHGDVLSGRVGVIAGDGRGCGDVVAAEDELFAGVSATGE